MASSFARSSANTSKPWRERWALGDGVVLSLLGAVVDLDDDGISLGVRGPGVSLGRPVIGLDRLALRLPFTLFAASSVAPCVAAIVGGWRRIGLLLRVHRASGGVLLTASRWRSRSVAWIQSMRHPRHDLDGSGKIMAELFKLQFAGNLRPRFGWLLTRRQEDGKINPHDAAFCRLLVWQDTNHDGVSDAGELKSLAELGITGINLNFSATLLPITLPARPTRLISAARRATAA